MKKMYWIIIAFALILLILGTFLDVQINQSLHAPGSPFGQFFAVAAMVPIWILIPIATGLMFGFLITQFSTLNYLWRFLCLALLLFGLYGIYERMLEMVGSRHLHGLPYGALVWMVVLTFMGATALGAHFSRRHPREVMIAAFVGLTAIAGSRLILDNIKTLWGRQRFWTMDNPLLQFTPWYAPQFPNQERMTQMGDAIKSFPSGHSMGSISTLWLSMLPSFLPFCQKHLSAWVNGLSLFALSFWGGTIFSRILLGEHFLSDVAISGIIFLLFFLFFTFLANKYIPLFPASQQASSLYKKKV